MTTFGSSNAFIAGRAKSIGRPDLLYPSPFFDVAGTYMPKSVRDTYAWVSFYARAHSVISPLIAKASAYPITQPIYRHTNKNAISRFSSLMRKLGLRVHLNEMNYDRYSYGNAYGGVHRPFKKFLECRECGHKMKAEDATFEWKDYNFYLDCPKCHCNEPAKVSDVDTKLEDGIRLIRYNVDTIDVDYNEYTGERRYYYRIPRNIRNRITKGYKTVLLTTRQEVIDAIRLGKSLEIQQEHIFHMRRVGPSRVTASTRGGEDGLGEPVVLPVLKDVWLTQVLKKSQEAVALEHVVPMRILYPEARSSGQDPYSQINLRKWASATKGHVSQWKNDPNHIVISPIPVGYQHVGGQGRSYLLHQELRFYNEQLISGMGFPVSFYYGDSTYSGASVNMRALENEFLSNREDLVAYFNFLLGYIGRYCFGVKDEIPEGAFKPFKMADDLSRQSQYINLYMQRVISKKSLFDVMGLDVEAEYEQMQKEAENEKELQVRQAEIQAVAQAAGQKIMMEAQANMQQMQAEQGGGQMPPGGGQPPPGGEGGAPQQGGQPQQPGGPPAGGPPQQEGMPPQQGGAPQPAMLGAGGGTLDAYSRAFSEAQRLQGMPEAARNQAVMQLRANNPQLYGLVQSVLINNQAGAQPQQGGPSMELPEQRPPRTTGIGQQV